MKNRTIKITSNGHPGGTQILNSDGTPIPGVQSAELVLKTTEPFVAVLDILFPEIDVELHPMLSLESLEDAAEYYGFDLVPKAHPIGKDPVDRVNA